MIRILSYSASHSVRNLGFKTSTWLERRSDNYRNDVIVRWGNAGGTEYRNVLNPAKAITLNMNKVNAHEVLSGVVKTPRLYRKYTPNFGLFVIRPLTHQGGSGFKVVEAKGRPIDLSAGWQYATEFLRTNAEYRVWFCGNKTLRAQRARTREQQSRGPVDRFPCRSQWGYNFCYNVPENLHNQTLKAARTIGLDCGAADVLLHNGYWYFLELNSAPSTDLPCLERWFRNGITQLANQKFGL